MSYSAKSPSHRQLRVGEEIRHILSAIFMRGDVHNKELSCASITISEVRVSPDLKNATVFVMPLAGARREEILIALKENAPYLRHLLSKQLTTRYVPSLKFMLDGSFDYAEKIENLIKAVVPHNMEHVTVSQKVLQGIFCRTNNASELNGLSSEGGNFGKIAKIVQKYFLEDISDKILEPLNPGVTYVVYTDYENGASGDYTCFIGEEVRDTAPLSAELTQLVVPEQYYLKVTSEKGQMPGICQETWGKIWNMTSKELGGDRAYLADFEVYDKRAQDPQNTILDIFIGLKM